MRPWMSFAPTSTFSSQRSSWVTWYHTHLAVGEGLDALARLGVPQPAEAVEATRHEPGGREKGGGGGVRGGGWC
jgi:hypothetical protein